jgi:hypothetical protein
VVPEHCLVVRQHRAGRPTAPNILFKLALPDHLEQQGADVRRRRLRRLDSRAWWATCLLARPTSQRRSAAATPPSPATPATRPTTGSLDGSWGLNDEAVRNFGGDALKKTRDAAIFLHQRRATARSA